MPSWLSAVNPRHTKMLQNDPIALQNYTNNCNVPIKKDEYIVMGFPKHSRMFGVRWIPTRHKRVHVKR